MVPLSIASVVSGAITAVVMRQALNRIRHVAPDRWQEWVEQAEVILEDPTHEVPVEVITDLNEDPTGTGRQHKAFQYSREGMTADEKAKERAKHYRTVARAKAVTTEKMPNAPRTAQYYHKETGEKVAPYSSQGKTRVVELTKAQQATESARGLKEKTTKSSSRKPYVGAKMKRDFLATGKTAEDLKKAIKLYKKGEATWESLTGSGSPRVS